MKLHGSLNSPFARMAMVTAMECGLGMRVQLVSTSVNPTQVQSALEAMSPIAKIPVLESDDGQIIYDSRVIMEYFCHLSGNKKLLPDAAAQRYRVLTLLAMAQGLGDACVGLRYETFSRPAGTVWPQYASRQQSRIAAVMHELQSKWLSDLADLTLGSIAVAVVLGYVDLRQLAPDWKRDHHYLADWQNTFSKRESMAHTAPQG